MLSITLAGQLAKLRQEDIHRDARSMRIELGRFQNEEEEILALERDRIFAQDLGDRLDQAEELQRERDEVLVG